MPIPLTPPSLSAEPDDPPMLHRRAGTVTLRTPVGVEYRVYDLRRGAEERSQRVRLGSPDATHRLFLARELAGERPRLRYEMVGPDDHALDERTVLRQLAGSYSIDYLGVSGLKPESRDSSSA